MAEPITTNTSVREAVARYPGIEKIFDAHGLTGCGGQDGPAEPIGFFAAVHNVDTQRLIAQLNEYAASQQAARANRASLDPGRHTYPLFLTTSMVIALSTGVTSGIAAAMTGGGWGALRGEAWLAMVQTHGHVQVFGYVLLFVMGIALHILPRFKGQQPPARWLMLAAFWSTLAGVFLRASAQPHGQGFLRGMLGVSAVFELVGIALFAAVMAGVSWRSRDKREPYDRFIVGATAWLVAVGGMNAYLTLRAAVRAERVLNAPGDAALLQASIYGFVVLMVLGVSYRALPHFLSLRPSYGGLRDAGLAAIVVALPVRVAAVWAPQFGRFGWTERGDQFSTFALAIGVVAAVTALRVFESPEPGRPEVEAPPAFRPMVQAAYGWLLAGVALDVYWRLREMEGGFTPFYAAGAIRHAFLLGFATLMLMAMTYRTVPVFSGRPLRWPAAVPASFVMVVLAAVLRVAPVALTPVPSKLDFKLLTAGGFLLFFGLGIFFVEFLSSMFARFAGSPARATGVEVGAPGVPATSSTVHFGTMRHEPDDGERLKQAPSAPRTERPSGPVTRDMTVAAALDVHPRVLPVLLDYGFGPLASSEMRETVARRTTLERAAAFVGADADQLVDTLNLAVGSAPANVGEAHIDIRLEDATATEAAVRAALKACHDPEIPVNIVDLGLVYSVAVRDAYAHVQMTLTAPGCPMADEVKDQVKAALLGVPGIDTVDVNMVEEPAWTPERMSAAAREVVGW